MAALLPCRRDLHAHVQTPLTQATRFLHKDYKIDYFYWELFELSRRNVLVGWVLLIPTEDTFLRLVIALLLSIASLTLLLSVNPYARPEGAPHNVLAASCQLTLIFGFTGATYIRLFHEIERVNGAVIVERIMFFSSTTAVALPLVIVTLGMMVLILAIVVGIVLREGHVQTIRLVATHMPPELKLDRGQRWHLLLSHTWASAQE
eukprot:3186902-Prymnesium_polylepis.2